MNRNENIQKLTFCSCAGALLALYNLLRLGGMPRYQRLTTLLFEMFCSILDVNFEQVKIIES